MQKLISFLTFLVAATSLYAQPLTPEVTSWIINLNGQVGYSGIASNVQKVQYSSSFVYVSCTCIPGYDIGPWAGNPNIPANQNFEFKITRSPKANTGTPTPTPLGHIGIWSNGVSIFNAKDARSYNNAAIWNQNAIVVEGASFDSCLGHPAPNGEYHHHLNPRCLYDSEDSTRHSPLIGYAFDGFPIYGAYAYSDVNGAGGITRMRTSYRMRTITDRTALADGTKLSSNQYGPAISQQYPVGYYCEDFEYVKGLGDLDEHNGRFSVTPEYPNGIYAYYVTLDAQGTAVFPYTLGLTYYGEVSAGNTGPQSGHNVPTEGVTEYSLVSNIPIDNITAMSLYPNPANNLIRISLPSTDSHWVLTIFDVDGNLIRNAGTFREGVAAISLLGILKGEYFLRLTSGSQMRSLAFTITATN